MAFTRFYCAGTPPNTSHAWPTDAHDSTLMCGRQKDAPYWRLTAARAAVHARGWRPWPSGFTHDTTSIETAGVMARAAVAVEGAEAQLRAAQLGAEDRHGLAGALPARAKRLVALFDMQAKILARDPDLPFASHARRYQPKVRLAALAANHLVRLPLAERELMRDDARAGPQRDKPRSQLFHHAGADVQRNHRGLREVGLEEVALDGLHAIRHATGRGRVAREAYQIGFELDADGTRAEVLRRMDRDATVTRAEVEHEVARRGVGELQHALDQLLRRRHPDRVFADLAQMRRVAWLRCRGGGAGENEPNQRRPHRLKRASRQASAALSPCSRAMSMKARLSGEPCDSIA